MNLDSAVFYSHDILKIIPFYTETLGFKLEKQDERFVSFIFPDGARLGIKNQTEDREIPGHQTVFITIDNIDELFTKLTAKNVEIYKELRDHPWGKEFSILDPDKNKVLFLDRKSP